MVAQNPLFASWSLKKFRATVINDIWPEVLFFTLIATMVSLVSKMTTVHLVVSNAMLTVLGTVLGLVISFRTSTAYERFMEGRKLWTNISIASRNLAQIIWIHVPFDRTDKTTGEVRSTLHMMIEKKSMVNLVQAFSVSVKHLLRGEGGVYYSDLYPLVSFLPRYANAGDMTEEEMLPLWKASDMDHKTHHALRSNSFNEHSLQGETLRRSRSDHATDATDEKGEMGERRDSWMTSLGGKSRRKTFDPEQALAVLPSERPLAPARNPPEHTVYDYLPFLRIFKPLIRLLKRSKPVEEPSPISARRSTFLGKKIRPEAADSNVPLEITLFLSTYFAFLLKQGQLLPASASAMVTAISQLQDTVSNLERIKNTPLPFAYQAHLRVSLWLYLFFLPFQVFSAFGYLTIPATAFASFLLLGFLEIGQEIENPFNYDLNDLDLDTFCLSVQRELQEITAHTCPEPSSFLFTDWNQPFAPGDRRSAKVMMEDSSHAYHQSDAAVRSIRKTLLQSWREVDEVTRK